MLVMRSRDARKAWCLSLLGARFGGASAIASLRLGREILEVPVGACGDLIPSFGLLGTCRDVVFGSALASWRFALMAIVGETRFLLKFWLLSLLVSRKWMYVQFVFRCCHVLVGC